MLFECRYCHHVTFSEVEEMLNETNTYYLVSVRCEYCAKLQRQRQSKPKEKTDNGEKNQNEAPKPEEKGKERPK